MTSSIQTDDAASSSRPLQQPLAPATSDPSPQDVSLNTSSTIDTSHEPLADDRLATESAVLPPSTTGTARSEDIVDDTTIVVQPRTAQISSSRGRGRGGLRGGRGRSRTSLSSAKARKRKRSDQHGSGNHSDNSEDPSSDEVCTPTAVTTKSGRSVQRPTSFAPPANASPNGDLNGAKTASGNGDARVYKKKRVWRRNADNAVCKSCLRGTSPASNMIVFCDGCNTPYHRWCHHPPISQAVIDEPDKEWYCRGCARERVVPVPESELAHWIAAPGATSDERRQFFMSLTPGTMVTLLMRATDANTVLPLYAPDWVGKASSRSIAQTSNHTSDAAPAAARQDTGPQVSSHDQPHSREQAPHQQPSTIYVQHDDEDEDEGYGAEEHPPHYVRPGKGLMSTLPPDKEDEKVLVDDDGSRDVFRHIYLVDESTAKHGVNGTPS